MSTDTANEQPASTGTPSTPDEKLKALAKEIRRHHTKFLKALRASIHDARAAGEALKKAKKIAKEDGRSFGHWRTTHCKLSPRQAQKYMKIAEGFDEIKRSHDPDQLTINQALALLKRLRTKEKPAGQDTVRTDTDKSRRIVLLPDELHTRTGETHRLVSSNQILFTKDSPEGQFVREKVTTLIRQIRNQAAKPRTAQGESDPVQPVHLAIALIERLSQELYPGVLVKAPESKEESPVEALESKEERGGPASPPVPPPSPNEAAVSLTVPPVQDPAQTPTHKGNGEPGVPS
jgi:hypothetical protein